MSPSSAFLKQQISRCTISMVVDRDCTKLQSLHMLTYTGIHIFSVSPLALLLFLYTIVECEQDSVKSATFGEFLKLFYSPALPEHKIIHKNIAGPGRHTSYNCYCSHHMTHIDAKVLLINKSQNDKC